jgi:hypothetical protein
MTEIIETTLTALARIDSEALRIEVDRSLYPEGAIAAFLQACGPHVRASADRQEGRLWLTITAADPNAARIQIGNALTDLLRLALRERG